MLDEIAGAVATKRGRHLLERGFPAELLVLLVLPSSRCGVDVWLMDTTQLNIRWPVLALVDLGARGIEVRDPPGQGGASGNFARAEYILVIRFAVDATVRS